MSIIKDLHEELKDNVVITHRITNKFLGNESAQMKYGTFDEINIGEEFSVKFLVRNNNMGSINLEYFILQETEFAEYSYDVLRLNNFKLPGGSEWESPEFKMVAKKKMPMARKEQFAKVSVKMQLDIDSFLTFFKHEMLTEEFRREVPAFEHN
jgi:hypothetical protein